MDRAELERLDRTSLISQAEALGVARANILTRPELVDELLVRTARKDDLPRARGLFGRARDLVARVIEKGLHLPDAAERFRQASVTAATDHTTPRAAPAVVPTVTLAEIYAAQGHRSRAIETLRRVMDVEPDHGVAEALLTKLETAPVTIPPAAPPLPPEDDDSPAEAEQAAAPASDDQAEETREPETLPRPEASVVVGPATSAATSAARREPVGFLDDDPLPIRYDVDECVALAVDPVTLYVYWEVRESTLERVRRLRAGGSLTLRLLVVTPSWEGPRSAIRDFDVDAPIANRIVRDLPAGAVVRAAIGWRTGEVYLPIAHAPALETPVGAASPVAAESFVRWTPRGLTPVTKHDSDYPSIERALGRLPPQREARYELSSPPALGSSELSAGFGPPAGGGSEGGRGSELPSSEAFL